MNPQVRALLEAFAVETAHADATTRHAAAIKLLADEATLDAVIEAQQQLLEEAEKRAELEAQRLHSTEQKAHKHGLLLSGEYYFPMERVWIRNTAPYSDKGLFEILRREAAPAFGIPSSSSVTLQKVTLLHRQAVNNISSLDTEAENAKWPTNVFGEPDAASQIAHLVPIDCEHASMYSDVARCVLALGDDTIQQKIHGTKSFWRPARVLDSGIKYFPFSQIRLPNHTLFFDQLPCVLIVPIMELEQMKDWKLEGYEAIVLAGAYNTVTAAEAYRGIQMFDLTLATPDEIEIARKSLVQVVQGLAYSLVHRRRQRNEKSLEPEMRRLLQSFRENLQNSDSKGEIFVPMAAPACEGDLRIGKVSFHSHAPQSRGILNHPAPDPMFLAIKAAINWSRRNGQQLLVTGEPEEEKQGDELDSWSEEETTEWPRETI
jgi:hypothetical protein